MECFEPRDRRWGGGGKFGVLPLIKGECSEQKGLSGTKSKGLDPGVEHPRTPPGARGFREGNNLLVS